MEVRNRSNRWRRRHSAVHMSVDRKQVVFWKPVFPTDRNSFIRPGFDRGARVLALVSPQSGGRKLRVELGLKLEQTNLIMRAVAFLLYRIKSWKNGQWVDVAIELRAEDDRQGGAGMIVFLLCT